MKQKAASDHFYIQMSPGPLNIGMSLQDLDSMESSINNLKHRLLDAINNTKSHKSALSIFLDNENQELDLFDFMLQTLKQTDQIQTKLNIYNIVSALIIKNRKLPVNNYSDILIKTAIDAELPEIVKILLSFSQEKVQSIADTNSNVINANPDLGLDHNSHNNIVNDNTNNNNLKENLLVSLSKDEKERLEWITDQSEEQLKKKRRRKEALEKIEKIRETHKSLRTEDWSQRDNDDEEFSQYYLNECSLSKHECKALLKDLLTFHEINNWRCKSFFLNETIPILMIQMEDAGIQMSSYVNEKDYELVEVYQKICDLIKEIAVNKLFYKDLKQFNQSCIDSTFKFDDNRPLRGYEFHRDRLANWLDGKINREKGEHFYKERAFRYRFIRDFFGNEGSHSSLIRSLLSSETLERIEMLLARFDHLTNKRNLLKVKLLKSLIPETKIYLIGNGHICRLLVECFCFHRLEISPSEIYSIDYEDREWCYRHIQNLHHDSKNLFMIGNESSKSVKDLAYKLQIPFRLLEDFDFLLSKKELKKQRLL